MDPALARLIQKAKEDEDYQSVYEAIESFKEVHKLPDGHPGQMFKMHWHALSTEPDMPNLILYHGRIVVPEAARNEALENLHIQHAGETKTLQLARSLYFWPGMTRTIRKKVSNCPECLEMRPSRPREPLIQTLDVSRPFEAVSIDLGYFKGDHYLVMVDRYSTFFFVQRALESASLPKENLHQLEGRIHTDLPKF